jgi:hypothetical protein
VTRNDRRDLLARRPSTPRRRRIRRWAFPNGAQAPWSGGGAGRHRQPRPTARRGRNTLNPQASPFFGRAPCDAGPAGSTACGGSGRANSLSAANRCRALPTPGVDGGVVQLLIRACGRWRARSQAWAAGAWFAVGRSARSARHVVGRSPGWKCHDRRRLTSERMHGCGAAPRSGHGISDGARHLQRPAARPVPGR